MEENAILWNWVDAIQAEPAAELVDDAQLIVSAPFRAFEVLCQVGEEEFKFLEHEVPTQPDQQPLPKKKKQQPVTWASYFEQIAPEASKAASSDIVARLLTKLNELEKCSLYVNDTKLAEEICAVYPAANVAVSALRVRIAKYRHTHGIEKRKQQPSGGVRKVHKPVNNLVVGRQHKKVSHVAVIKTVTALRKALLADGTSRRPIRHVFDGLNVSISFDAFKRRLEHWADPAQPLAKPGNGYKKKDAQGWCTLFFGRTY